MEQSTPAGSEERSPSSPQRPGKMISPPDSVSGESSTSSDGFDPPADLNAQSSRLTSCSSVQTSDPKPVNEEGQTTGTLPEAVAAEQNVHENGGTTPTPIQPVTRVHRDMISTETLRTYHIDYLIDSVSN